MHSVVVGGDPSNNTWKSFKYVQLELESRINFIFKSHIRRSATINHGWPP